MPTAAQARRQAGSRKGGQKNKSSLESSMGNRISTLLLPQTHTLNQGLHGQLLPAHAAPPTYPGPSRHSAARQPQLAPTSRSTYPVLSTSTCSNRSDTQNLQKDAFWDVNRSLFKCCSINFNLNLEGKKNGTVIQSPSTTQGGNQIR